jgi:fructokinase
MMTAKVWVLGDAVVDLLPDDSGHLLQCPGGAPANVAVGIARLAGISGFIGRVGDDPFGHFMKKTLKDESVDTEYMIFDPTHHTSTVVVTLDKHGERSFTFMVKPSADLFLEPTDLPMFQPKEWLHSCSIALSSEPSRASAFIAMRRMHNVGGFISFDPNIREDLWPSATLLRQCLWQALAIADVVKLSQEELLFICGDTDPQQSMLSLAETYHIQLLLVTMGKAGVQVLFNNTMYHFQAPEIVSIDTTGAGDAFVAGLLWGLAEYGLPQNDAQLAQRIAVAQTCGALATTAKGAMTALPLRAQLQP